MSKKSTRRVSTAVKLAVKRSTQESLATLHQCCKWLYSTYASEIAELAQLHAGVRVGAVFAEDQEAIDHRSQIALTVEDRLVTDEFNCGLTFTFLDASHPPVQFGYVSFSSFTDMTRRFFKDLPTVKSIYQARSEFVAATGLSPAHVMPDVGYQAAQDSQEDAIKRQWFTGDALPKPDESQYHYPRSKLVALVNTYDQWADEGV